MDCPRRTDRERQALILQNNDAEKDSMIQSMTGFGRAELVDEKRKITVEMKSVNHRYADITIKMPSIKTLPFYSIFCICSLTFSISVLSSIA